MRVIAIANQKGGVGKTTTAVNLAAALVRQGHRALLADLDAQAGATVNCLGKFGDEGRVVHDVIHMRVPIADAVVPTRGGFDLLPSDLSLVSIDAELALKANPDGRLRTALGTVADRYDFALVDCPGWMGLATLNAFAAAQFILLPIDCKAQALESVVRLMKDIQDTAAAHNRPIGTLALPTFYERRVKLAQDVLAQIKKRFGTATLPPIHKNTALAEAYRHRQTIYEYDPASTGALDYYRAAKEVIGATREEEVQEGRETRTV